MISLLWYGGDARARARVFVCVFASFFFFFFFFWGGGGFGWGVFSLEKLNSENIHVYVFWTQYIMKYTILCLLLIVSNCLSRLCIKMVINKCLKKEKRKEKEASSTLHYNIVNQKQQKNLSNQSMQISLHSYYIPVSFRDAMFVTTCRPWQIRLSFPC